MSDFQDGYEYGLSTGNTTNNWQWKPSNEYIKGMEAGAREYERREYQEQQKVEDAERRSEVEHDCSCSDSSTPISISYEPIDKGNLLIGLIVALVVGILLCIAFPRSFDRFRSSNNSKYVEPTGDGPLGSLKIYGKTNFEFQKNKTVMHVWCDKIGNNRSQGKSGSLLFAIIHRKIGKDMLPPFGGIELPPLAAGYSYDDVKFNINLSHVPQPDEFYTVIVCEYRDGQYMIVDSVEFPPELRK
jgi:hypothetical protein